MLSRRGAMAALALLPALARARAADPGESPATPSPAAPVDKPGPRIVAVFGDSQAEGLAVALRRATKQMPNLKVQNHTKAGTAIGQPENYDWQAAIRDYAPDPGTDTAVLMFGGNDRLPMRPAPATTIAFKSPAWEDIYRARTADILRNLTEKHLRVIWVGNPVCREAKYTQDMAYLNGLYKDTATNGQAAYLDIWTVIADAEGHFSAYGKGLDGATARMRLDDGIHFTPAGYDVVAAKVLKAVLAADAK